MYEYFRDVREKQRLNAIQIPYSIKKSGQIVFKFWNVDEPEQIMFDYRTDYEKEKMLCEDERIWTLNP